MELRPGLEIVEAEDSSSNLDFGTALDALKDGDKIRRSNWDKGAYWFLDGSLIRYQDGNILHAISIESVLANDWEIME